MASITVVELAKHAAFVVLAYLCAFGILTAASVFDFISSTWRTVHGIRVRGLVHLGALVVAMMYMMAYIVIHGVGGEVTEMSAGIVALLLGCVDFCRTIVGLWQLHVFRQWIVRSIGSLESLGYVAKWDGTNDSGSVNSSVALIENAEERAYRIADCVIVNDTIVENRLSEGDMKCTLERNEVETEHSLKDKLVIPLKWLMLLVHAPRIIASILLSKTQSYTNSDYAFYLNPRTPEDVWMKWACVLVGQVFPEWLEDMRNCEISDVTGEMGTPERVLRFTRGVLCSGALHTQSALSGAMANAQEGVPSVGEERQNVLQPHSFLRFDEWEEYPKLRQGLFSEQEFLTRACRTGSGLPFGAKHAKAAKQGPKGEEYGYARFKSKLDRIIESFPVEKTEALAGFGTPELEWLAIFLSIENWNAGFENVGRHVSVTEDTTYGPSADASVESGDSHSYSPSSDEKEDYEAYATHEASSIAMQNLQLQFGIERSESNPSGFGSPSLARFPLLRTALQTCFLTNRNVLEASLHIDNTLALCAGDQYTVMRVKEEDTKERLSKARAWVGLGEADGSFCGAEPKTEAEIERERFLYQFTCEEPEFSHLEQRMTFLGCSMENLRSSLAKWVQNHPNVDACVWTPVVPRLGGKTPAVFMFRTSDSFAPIAYRCMLQGNIEDRHSQMRLLWELQSYFHRSLPENGTSPEAAVAMILCILSFPTLQVQVTKEAMSIELTGDSVRTVPEGVSISVENQQRINLTICVPLSSDPVHVGVSLIVRNERHVSAAVWMSVGCIDGERVFRWEKWRDAFNGRLEGIMQWQKTHGLPWGEVVGARGGIEEGVQAVRTSGTGTGREMSVWVGWPPHRPSMCLFEVKSEEFIVQTVREDVAFPIENITIMQFSGIVKSKHYPVNYADAERADLEHSSVVARVVINWLMEMDTRDTEVVEIHGEQLLERTSGEVGLNSESLEWRLKVWESISAETKEFEVLESAIRMLCWPGNHPKDIRRATKLMESFCSLVGSNVIPVRTGCAIMMFKDNHLSETVISMFKRLVISSAADPSVLEALSRMCTSFENYRTSEFFEFACDALCNGILQLHFTSRTAEIGSLVSQLGSIVGHMRPGQQALSFLLVRAGGTGLDWESLGKQLLLGSEVPPCAELAAMVFSVGAVETKNMACVNWLGIIYEYGAGNISACTTFALELYQRAVEEGNHISAMNNLAFLLENGGEGVTPDMVRAVQLYERSIEEGNNTFAMNNLALLLENGGEGVPADHVRAVQLYERSIEEGNNTVAMYNLACLLRHGGNGVEIDRVRAVQLYNRVIDEDGDTDAMNSLALLLEEGGEGVTPDMVRAVQLYERAIEEGNNTSAMNNLANLLRNGGEGVPADHVRAVQLYERSIEEGNNTVAMYNLAGLLQNGGEGVEIDRVRAVQLYNRVIDEDGDADAMNRLALLLEVGGEGVTPDFVRAIQLYERSIEEGNTSAICNLADLLQKGGEGVEPDLVRAVELYSRAIDEDGDTDAMNSLALLLERGGEGVIPDMVRAVQLYERSIEEGNNTVAMNNLAALLQKGGEGVRADLVRAVELYSRAIDEDGSTDAMCNLGDLLQKGGEGVEPDLVKAIELYNRAIDEDGNTDAMNSLANVLENGGEGVAANLVSAVQLYERSIEEGNNTVAMCNLARILQKGGEGVDADHVRSAELHGRAIKEG